MKADNVANEETSDLQKYCTTLAGAVAGIPSVHVLVGEFGRLRDGLAHHQLRDIKH